MHHCGRPLASPLVLSRRSLCSSKGPADGNATRQISHFRPPKDDGAVVARKKWTWTTGGPKHCKSSESLSSNYSPSGGNFSIPFLLRHRDIRKPIYPPHLRLVAVDHRRPMRCCQTRWTAVALLVAISVVCNAAVSQPPAARGNAVASLASSPTITHIPMRNSIPPPSPSTDAPVGGATDDVPITPVYSTDNSMNKNQSDIKVGSKLSPRADWRVVTVREARELFTDDMHIGIIAAPIFIGICLIGLLLSTCATLYQSRHSHSVFDHNHSTDQPHPSKVVSVHLPGPHSRARPVTAGGGVRFAPAQVGMQPERLLRPTNTMRRNKGSAPWERHKSRASVLVAALSPSGFYVADDPVHPYDFDDGELDNDLEYQDHAHGGHEFQHAEYDHALENRGSREHDFQDSEQEGMQLRYVQQRHQHHQPRQYHIAPNQHVPPTNGATSRSQYHVGPDAGSPQRQQQLARHPSRSQYHNAPDAGTAAHEQHPPRQSSRSPYHNMPSALSAPHDQYLPRQSSRSRSRSQNRPDAGSEHIPRRPSRSHSQNRPDAGSTQDQQELPRRPSRSQYHNAPGADASPHELEQHLPRRPSRSHSHSKSEVGSSAHQQQLPRRPSRSQSTKSADEQPPQRQRQPPTPPPPRAPPRQQSVRPTEHIQPAHTTVTPPERSFQPHLQQPLPALDASQSDTIARTFSTYAHRSQYHIDAAAVTGLTPPRRGNSMKCTSLAAASNTSLQSPGEYALQTLERIYGDYDAPWEQDDMQSLISQSALPTG
ncbi:hypothetical protein DFJ77DRAFT_443323 [Powellomyces hirtus]|nr:hypothetical protein DFJ77DRAFT_443323 [Powellomyces hirtus]